MYTLYLLRHGQTLYNLQRLVQGRCDSPLTSTGIQQAKAAGAWLAAQDVVLSAIHSSPLKRAMDTAYAVSIARFSGELWIALNTTSCAASHAPAALAC